MGYLRVGLTALFLACFHKSFVVTVSVSLKNGQLTGLDVDSHGVTKFLGVPYAASPTDTRRFAPPEDRPSWSPTVLDATLEKPVCPQDLHELQMASGVMKTNFNVSFDLPPSYSEDCLYLNIFIPGKVNSSKVLPVMVNFQDNWLQTISPESRDGTYLVANGDVIVVIVNYRLGALGFYGAGNFGLLDQKHALQWVQENIAAFGGDPKKVTIFGSGSGAYSVGLHVISPASQGLFSRAISQGGHALMTEFFTPDSKQITSEFTAKLNCTDGDLSCLRNLSIEQILEAQKNLNALGHYFMSSVDGTFIESPGPAEMLYRGNFTGVDYILGFNNDAGTMWNPYALTQLQTGITEQEYLATLKRWAYTGFQPNPDPAYAFLQFEYRATLDNTGLLPGQVWLRNSLTASRDAIGASMRAFQRLYSRHGKVFAYYFDQKPSSATFDPAVMSAPSGIEKLYLFGQENDFLSQHMVEAWTTFAKNGSPQFTSSGTTVVWPQYDAESSPQFLILRNGMTSSNINQQYPDRMDRRMDLWSDVLVELSNVTVSCKPETPETTGPPRVSLSQGELEGTTESVQGFTIEKYIGIPYAEPPIGQLRWKRPQPHSGWSGVRNNSSPVMCPQADTGFDQPGEIENEDCLHLDVYVPYGVKHIRFLDEIS